MISTFALTFPDYHLKLRLIGILDTLKLNISYTNWKTSYTPNSVMEEKNTMAHALFMTKELSRGIMKRYRIKSKYNKWSSRENFLALKQAKNKCTNLTKTAKKIYFGKTAEKQPITNKSFWNSISLFLSNKDVINDAIIILKEKW